METYAWILTEYISFAYCAIEYTIKLTFYEKSCHTGIVSQRKCGGCDAKCFALYILV
jgi:hypothetical protein